jgi:hypothetical protein
VSRADRADRLDSWSVALVAVTGALVLAAVAQVAAGGVRDPLLTLIMVLFIGAGGVARVALAGGREALPLATAGALGYALLPSVSGSAVSYDPWQAILTAAAGLLLGALPHLAVGRTPSVETIARQVLLTGVAAWLFRSTPLTELAVTASPPTLALILMGIVVVALGLDVVVGALLHAGRSHAPLAPALLDEGRALGAISAAVGATGVLIALAADFMGVLALPVFAIPLLLAQFAFRRYAGIRETYQQTIRSLSRLTEVGGYTEPGHAVRVSRLARAVGQEMGLTEAQLVDLEYAALLHDLGQLSLTEAIPGGATVMVPPPLQERIAAQGAAVIRQTGVLDEVAEIVDKQAAPYRQAHQLDDETVPLASRIIRAVNAYDDLVADAVEPGVRRQALERLRLDMAYEFDPRVVAVLSRVVERSLRSR